jgi:hypothetical protein
MRIERAPPLSRRRRLPLPCQLLQLPHRQAFGQRLFEQLQLLGQRLNPGEDLRMPLGELALRQGLLDFVWEPQEPQGVGDGAALLSDHLRQPFLRVAELLDQALKRRGFFKRIEILPMQIFDQRHLDGLLVVERLDDRWNFLQSNSLCRSPPSLSGDQLIDPVGDRAHDHRLDHAQMLDGRFELFQRALVDRLARLVSAGLDLIHPNGYHVWICPHRRARDLRQPFS